MDMDRNLFRGVAWRLGLAALLVGVACAKDAAPADRVRANLSTLRDIVTVPTRARPDLVENSAAVMSAQYPGVLYTVNDSGNEPLLFALDTTGADRGVWRIAGATNVDWEAASIGRCANDARPRCVYIGDVGDNESFHSSRTIYRVAEAEPRDSSFTGALSPDSVSYTYPDGKHDVEAMYVAPNGDTFLITKRPERARTLHLRPALVYRLPASVWTQRNRVVAERVDSLPIVPGSTPLRTITDASLSFDAKHLAVRTYGELYIFATDSLTGRVNHAVGASVCDIAPLGEPQGEGVSWARNDGRFVFSSEGHGVPLHIANCPLP